MDLLVLNDLLSLVSLLLRLLDITIDQTFRVQARARDRRLTPATDVTVGNVTRTTKEQPRE